MKKLKFILPLLIVSLFISCNSNDDDPINETADLVLANEFISDDNTTTVEVYTKDGNFYTGYNDLSIRVKNNSDNTYYENYSISWMPTMVMPEMTHSCPKSTIEKVSGKDTLYNGHLVFQMTNQDETGWSIKFMYTINGTEYIAQNQIMVKQSTRQRVTTFTGTDGVKYILAMVEPNSPEIKVNDMVVLLSKMENMMSFPVVEDYVIELDPRMPSMGNHSSIGNENLIYDTMDMMYKGKVALTMTGYWKLNLRLLNQNGDVLKGEEITENVLESSLYLEIEF